jgi:hypothetical protein
MIYTIYIYKHVYICVHSYISIHNYVYFFIYPYLCKFLKTGAMVGGNHTENNISNIAKKDTLDDVACIQSWQGGDFN